MTTSCEKTELRKWIDQFHLQDYVTDDLTEIAEVQFFQAGDYIAQEGTTNPYFHFLVQGESISYSYTCTGRIHCEAYMSGFNILGQAASLWKEPAFNEVVALTDCVCVAVRLDRYGERLLNDNRFLRFISHWMACHVRENAFRHNPLEVRMAKFILQVARANVFRFNLSQCADILETSYRHLLRTLKQMCAEGLLKREGNGYLILDATRMQQLSEGRLRLSTDDSEEK